MEQELHDVKQKLMAVENRMISNNTLVGELAGAFRDYMVAIGPTATAAEPSIRILQLLERYTANSESTFEKVNDLRSAISKLR